MRECEKRCDELAESNLEMSERLKEMEEEMNAAKEVIDILQQQNLGTCTQQPNPIEITRPLTFNLCTCGKYRLKRRKQEAATRRK